MKKINNKKILIIAGTHGNEKIGIELIKKLKLKKLGGDFDYLIANPVALREEKEFIDVNLNRVYPGNENSLLYEERLAYKNLKVARKYRYIIDIHEASKGKDDFIIIPKKKVSKLFPVRLIDLKKIILWPDPKGPISEVLENAIELEFGMKGRDRVEVIDKAFRIIENFIEKVSGNNLEEQNKKQEVYYVYGKLMEENFSGDINDLVDFEKTLNGKEEFYPLLTKQYMKYDIVCYKMIKKN